MIREVLLLTQSLAKNSGIRVAEARVELINNTAVAIIKRFDRTTSGLRIPYMSAATLLESTGRDDHAYSELVDAILRVGSNPIEDIQELWRRLVFNYLICNTDDHLRNTAFLYDATNKGWRLSPAFDLNPMPGDRRESKTWLTEDTGPVSSQEMLLERASYFRLSEDEAIRSYKHIEAIVSSWKLLGKEIGMNQADFRDFELAFNFDN